MFKIIITIGFILFTSQIALSQQWIYGKWQGRGRETRDGHTWSMKLRAQKGNYKIEYPSLKCGGDWRLLRYKGDTARFRETIRVNRKDCEPVGNMFIKRLRRSRLLFTYHYLDSAKVASSGILKRVK